MKITKAAQLLLDHNEIWCLRSLVSLAYNQINDCLRHESTKLGYTFQEMQQMAEFARRLEDL